MSTAYAIHISSSIRSDGSLLLQSEPFIGVAHLRDILFSWHEASFYGSTLDYDEKCVVVPPLLAIDYLSGSYASSHAPLQWSPLIISMKQAAPLLKYALENGLFAPDHEAWQMGKLGWKPLFTSRRQTDYLSAETNALEHGFSLKQWLTCAIHSFMSEDIVEKAWNQLSAAYPVLPATVYESVSKSVQQPPYDADEDEWLEVIGWKTNDIPFKAALQLIEPELASDGQDKNQMSSLISNARWSLSFALLDKSNGSLAALAESESIDTAIPVSWRPLIPAQLAKLSSKLFAITPQLESDDLPGDLRRQLSNEQAWEFLTVASLKLAEQGITVLLPAWWEDIRRNKPKLRARMKSSIGSSSQSLVGLDQLLQFDWRMSIGEMDLSEEQFLQLAATNQRILRFKDSWIVLEPYIVEQIKKAMNRNKASQGLTLRDIMELHLLGEEGVEFASSTEPIAQAYPFGVELNEQLVSMFDLLQQSGQLTKLDTPTAFNGTLRNYQKQGFAWLVHLRQFGLGGCLADDMGLGKTIQWIAYLQHVKQSEKLSAPALLICPTSVLGNWQKELRHFAPELNVVLHYGSARAKGDNFSSSLQGVDVIMTTYATAQLDEDELAAVKWSALCLDEAQNIKNAYTKQSAAVRRLEADHRIALTGTPIENRLTELWSIFDFINPGYLGSLNAFRRNYVTTIEKGNDERLIGQVQKLVKPFLLRRIKKDPAIQLDLPDKHEGKSYIPLTAEQSGLYESVLHDMLTKIDTLPRMERRGLILSTLTKLKQLCDHPALMLKDLRARTAIERSNKLLRLIEMVRELREEGDRCLIFTQYVEMGHMLQDVLGKEFNEPILFLHGGVSKSSRDRMVEQFQNQTLPQEQQCPVFILSLKAGGTGLNLTAANHVFHFDRWWNPAVENQATDRAFRIGQTRDVQVHKFISLGTIEERIDEMIERKLSITNQVVGSSENWITELSTGDLRELLALRSSLLSDS